ncbi:MAG: transposase [Burkholderiales bacterium]
MPLSLSSETAGHTFHVIERGHLHAACFFNRADRVVYLTWLGEYARQTGCAVHAYALMGNHVHLLLTPSMQGGISCLMQHLGRRYQRHLADTWQRAGPLWEAHFDITSVHHHRYVLACMRYIELNPVRARLAARPELFPWSSHRHNALGEENALITPHSAYALLARDTVARRLVYRGLFDNVRPGGARRAPQSRSQAQGAADIKANGEAKKTLGFKG